MKSPRAFLAALIIGVLAIPGFAVAGTMVLGSDGPPPEEALDDSTTTTTLEAPSTTIAVLAASMTAEDLVAACGADGMTLVDKEMAGTISAVEQGALDALRPICAANGLSLPDAPAPVPAEQVIIYETVAAPAAAAGSSTTVADSNSDDGYAGEGEYSDDAYEDGDHEDADHEDADHEDDHDDDDHGGGDEHEEGH